MHTDHRAIRPSGGGAADPGAPGDSSASAQGFTLIELLVLLGVLGLVMALGIPALQNFLMRSRTEGFVREVSTLMQRTRLEAIKANRQGAVFFDNGARRVVGFVDVNANESFDPVAGEPHRTTDFLVSAVPLPRGVSMRAPAGEDVIWNFSQVADGELGPSFQPDGSVRVEGAFRFADERDNFLEVRVSPPATGRISTAKWQAPPDGGGARWLPPPSPSADQDWEPWEWK